MSAIPEKRENVAPEPHFEGKSVGVVVPAHNEELLISKTLETMPDYLSAIIVVNDCSSDKTQSIIEDLQRKDPRITLINHERNRGLGQTLITGYLRARELELDIVAVMAGDAQMNPDDLPNVIKPIASGRADYVKGNRLLREEVIARMPKHRFIGNSGLTLLTKFATGYWQVIDPQCGYTAISKDALATIPIDRMIKGYGYNADILNMLNLNNFRVADVEVEPVYGKEKSGIKLANYIPTVSKLLVKLFIKRLTHKYLIREFHPLFFFYAFGAFSFILMTIPYTMRFFYLWFSEGLIHTTTLIFLLNTFTSSVLFLFLGMWMDMEENKRLTVREQ